MGKYFGTDGFRGEANEELTAEHAYKVGRFLGWYFTERKKREGDGSRAKIVIGKDTKANGTVEIKIRRTGEKEVVAKEQALTRVQEILADLRSKNM